MGRRPLALLLLAATAASPGLAARKKPVDQQAPVIAHAPPTTCSADAACVVEARITDASGVFDPTLLYRAAGKPTYERVPMTAPDATDLYRAAIPAALLTAGDVEYFVEAFDVQGNGPARAGAEDSPFVLPRLRPATPPPPTTTTVPAPTTAAQPAEADGSDTALLIGAGIAAGAVLIVAGVAVGVYALRPAAPDVVTIAVTAPAPIATVRP
jgi:hypothetical protein